MSVFQQVHFWFSWLYPSWSFLWTSSKRFYFAPPCSAERSQTCRPLLPPLPSVCLSLSSLTGRLSGVDIHHFKLRPSTSQGERFHSTHVEHISLWSFPIATAGMRALRRTSFSQLVQSAAAFIWRRSEFIYKLPPWLKYQTFLLLQSSTLVPLTNCGNIKSGTTALSNPSSEQFVKSAGISASVFGN